MSLDVVKKFAEENNNEELLNSVKEIEQSQAANLSRIAFLEKDIQNAIDKRERQATLVKSKLNLNELTDEALESAISDLSKKSSSGFEAEKNKLEGLINTLQTEKENLNKQLVDVSNRFTIEKKLNELGASKEVKGAKAFEILMDEATKGAVFENNELIFKANDGTTVRNADGTPTTLADRYNQLKESSDFMFLFEEPKTKSGSGIGNTKNVGSKPVSLDTLNYEQRIALFKQDPDLFKKLSKG